MRNDATLGIMPPEYRSFITLQVKQNQSLKMTACPSANQSLPKHDLLCITHDHRKTKTMYMYLCTRN